MEKLSSRLILWPAIVAAIGIKCTDVLRLVILYSAIRITYSRLTVTTLIPSAGKVLSNITFI